MNKLIQVVTLVIILPLLLFAACVPPNGPTGGGGGGGGEPPPDDPNGGDPGGGTGGRWAIIFSDSVVMFPEVYSTACQENVFDQGASLDFVAVDLQGAPEWRFQIYRLTNPETGQIQIIHEEDFAPEEMRVRIGLPEYISAESGEYYLISAPISELGTVFESREQLPGLVYCFLIGG